MTVPDQDRHPLTRPSRRQMIQGLVGLGLSAGGLAGCSRLGMSTGPALNGSPETTRIRVHDSLSLCQTPQYVAEELLRAEGFTDVQYISHAETGGIYQGLTSGMADVGNDFAPLLIVNIDAGAPLTVLGGLHVGCFELFGTDQIRAIRDLKGKTVAVRGMGTPPHVFLASMVAYVGLDPARDITWAIHSSSEAIQLLADGKVDAYMGFPPEPQQIRASSVGHVVVNSSTDRPWSQYFCCMTVANRDFAQRHPIATKRAQRAFLKAADICAAQPERAAQNIVDRGAVKTFADAHQIMTEVVYSRWREYDPADTIRFYSLRLQEIGMIKSTPDRIISQGANFRFFNELKQELKT